MTEEFKGGMEKTNDLDSAQEAVSSLLEKEAETRKTNEKSNDERRKAVSEKNRANAQERLPSLLEEIKEAASDGRHSIRIFDELGDDMGVGEEYAKEFFDEIKDGLPKQVSVKVNMGQRDQQGGGRVVADLVW